MGRTDFYACKYALKIFKYLFSSNIYCGYKNTKENFLPCLFKVCSTWNYQQGIP